MALEVEDGSGKANSNSYNSVAELRAFATARGITLPVADAEVEALSTRAMDYLEAQRSRYQGRKTWPRPDMAPAHPHAQVLQFPRVGVVLDCDYDLPGDVIPTLLKDAQAQALIEISRGFDPFAPSNGRVKKKTKVDVIETEYFSSTELGLSGEPMVSLPAVDALLAPLFTACGTGQFLKTVRV